MKYSNLKQTVLEILTEQYPAVVFKIETTEFGGAVTSFILEFEKEEELENLWQEIISMIAFYFQSKLDSDFEKWNLYVFFLVPTSVRKDIKYKIENDPVSSRKIVVDNYEGEPISTIISDHITNDSLSLAVTETSSITNLSKNPIIWEELQKRKPTSGKIKKKGKDPYILETLEAIEKRLQS